MRDLRAQVACGALQSLNRRLDVFFLEKGEKHLRMREIGRYIDGGNRHHPDAGIAYFPAQEIGQLSLDQVGHLARPPSAHNVLATSRTSNTSNWSPSLMSWKPLTERPTWKPDFTSRPSPLKRWTASSSPVCMPPLPRSPGTWAPRLPRPSCTYQPATVPTLRCGIPGAPR